MAEHKFTCQECGCNCESCVNNNSLHLHQEIEVLKQQLLERDHHIVQMETNMMNHARQYPNGEWEALKQELQFWNEKYDRLYDSHKKLQKVNQGLEDKLLKIVDRFETEKTSLTRELADLTSKLAGARICINELEEENNHYRNDCNIAVQLLQCKPSNFVAHKLSSLPIDLQEKVKMHMNQTNDTKKSNGPEYRTIRVPIPTFPPTAMVYSVNAVHAAKTDTEESMSQNSNNISSDYVSAAIMAKVLEERTRERNAKKLNRCEDCMCSKHLVNLEERSTQTGSPSFALSCAYEEQLAYVHSQSESFSNSDNYIHSKQNGITSTETII